MQRIGILDVDALTEELIRGLFQAVPDVQVFLSPGHSERAQRLAKEFPCWTLDNHQAVADEVDVIVRSIGTNAPDELLKGMTLRRTT